VVRYVGYALGAYKCMHFSCKTLKEGTSYDDLKDAGCDVVIWIHPTRDVDR
jgi:hypothetical protein